MLTLDLAKTVQRFMAKRAQAREEFLETRRSLEAMAGSKYHDTAMRAATEKREKAVKEAQSRTRAETAAIIDKMRHNAANIAADPPSAEQLAVLEVLKMRETISREELDEAAAAMGGCSMALAVVDDLAAKNGLYSNYSRTMSTRLSRSTVERMISDMERGINKILADEIGAAPGARLYAERQAMTQGMRIDLDALPQAPQPKDEFELLENLGITNFNAFQKAVDRGATNE